jgi:hypothetical protein
MLLTRINNFKQISRAEFCSFVKSKAQNNVYSGIIGC